MDTQRKKGLLEICVLAVLQREPSYGYKIIGDITPCIDISESTDVYKRQPGMLIPPVIFDISASEVSTAWRMA